MLDSVAAAGEALRALGSLSSMLSAYLALRRERRELSREDARQVVHAGEEGARRVSREGLADTVVRIISRHILDNARKKIDRAERRFGDAIADIRNTPQQVDQEAQIAKAEVCAMLQLIRDHNGNDLPDKELEDLWVQFRCDQTAP